MNKTVSVFPNMSKPAAKNIAVSYISKLRELGFCVLADMELRNAVKTYGVEFLPRNELFCGVDAALVIGGDGTILSAAHYASENDVPILSVNLGTIGYMSELEADETALLHKFASGEYTVEERMMLDGRVIRGGVNVFSLKVLNEIVVAKGGISKIVKLDLLCDDETVSTYRADALIACTPTGSTAYAMSAGGPIIDPNINTICVCPVCAYSLLGARPLIFSPNARLDIKVFPSGDADVWLTGDGRMNFSLLDGDKISIRRSSNVTKLIKIKNLTFFERLHMKIVL